MKLPKIDLKELDELKRQNAQERMRFIEYYAAFLKKKAKVHEERKLARATA